MITIKNLYFGYFKSKFLYENFSIKVNPGDRVGLIGSNGKGKSTFLRLLNGSLFPISGEITIKGKISSYITSRGLYDKGFSGLQNLHLFINLITKILIDCKYSVLNSLSILLYCISFI